MIGCLVVGVGGESQHVIWGGWTPSFSPSFWKTIFLTISLLFRLPFLWSCSSPNPPVSSVVRNRFYCPLLGVKAASDLYKSHKYAMLITFLWTAACYKDNWKWNKSKIMFFFLTRSIFLFFFFQDRFWEIFPQKLEFMQFQNVQP